MATEPAAATGVELAATSRACDTAGSRPGTATRAAVVGAEQIGAGLRTVSYGGGVQSTALLVLAARGDIDYRVFLFANVGDDSEDPATLAYLRRPAAPFAAANGLALHELHRTRRDGTPETLYGQLTKPISRSVPIPVRMSNGAPGRRSCTADFKIRVVSRWLRAHGASRARPATVAVGISRDEWHRAHNRRDAPGQRVVYPLLDLRLDRADCARIIRSAGLPVPPKSSCDVCPFHRPATWAQMRRDRGELFDRAVALEALLNQRRGVLGKDPVFLTRFARTLDEAIPPAQDPLPGLDSCVPEDDASCDNGACWT